jgi:hypothetical protein
LTDQLQPVFFQQICTSVSKADCFTQTVGSREMGAQNPICAYFPSQHDPTLPILGYAFEFYTRYFL